MERSNLVTMKGNPVTLVGVALKVGDKAPDFTVLDNGLAPIKLSDSANKARLLSVVPSLDTSVCNKQTVTFNKRLPEVVGNVKPYAISVDLPFAQGRFAQEHKIDRLQIVSDHRDVSFGNNYGLLIKELRLLARAVLVVDKNDRISYCQIVPEIGTEPDYDAAIEALKKAAR
ncbi:MAG TPA: thiol peroxidase [Candidatus Deferrimicrobium sp.]|nr:thiol peroxidase [Candidatus Deferrimicrobium sp.]